MSVQTLETIIENDSRDLFSFLEEREIHKMVFENYPETSININLGIKDQKDLILWDSYIRKLSLDLFGRDICKRSILLDEKWPFKMDVICYNMVFL
jgi:hypothetical protein